MKDIYPLLFPATFLLLLGLERLLPTRPQPRVRFWLAKSLVFFVIAGAINGIVPPAMAKLVAGHTLLDLTALGTIGGAVAGLLAAGLLQYWMHRTFHRVSWVWRWSHQLHHSAERVDIPGFAYSHPFELLIATSFAPVTSVLIGVSPAAAMVAGYVGFLLGLFTHLAIATPRWLGYIVQRPESHSLHHQRDLHAYNYSNIPLWDMLFGTFRNPTAFSEVTGFWDGASRRTFAMLLGRDVATPPTSPALRRSPREMLQVAALPALPDR